jgi:thiosulfate dehydrogenase
MRPCRARIVGFGIVLVLSVPGLSTTPAFSPPAMEDIPEGPQGDAVRLGYDIVINTHERLKDHVGNSLSCRNCHLDAGRMAGAGAFVGVYSALPEYRMRSARMTTIEIRINECFERSLNGTPLPYDSPEMGGLVTYIAWLSTGVPAGEKLANRGFPPLKIRRPGSAAKGREVFAGKCAACHGADGQGSAVAPPVWGPHSYNKGAGMVRVSIAASFIKRTMPLGQGGTLTDEEAYDVATFINSQPRPEFAARVHDWPKGGKPDDILY